MNKTQILKLAFSLLVEYFKEHNYHLKLLNYNLQL